MLFAGVFQFYLGGSHITHCTPVSWLWFQVKLLMDMEQQRRQDLDKMQEERVQLLELLNNIQQDQDQTRPMCHHCTGRGPPPPPPPSAGAGGGLGGGGRVTTL